MKTKKHFLAAATLLAATIPTIPTLANFEEASTYIDLDGSMVGYMDFEGDGLEIGTSLNEIYQQVMANTPQIPPIPVDFNLLIENLGFGSIKAIALSSKEVESGLHRNRSVALLDENLSGLFALYDTAPLSFTAAEKAPANATGAMTASINLGALRETSSRIMQQIMGPMGDSMIQQQLTQIIPGTDITYNEALDTLSGKWDGFWLQSYGPDFQQEFKFWLSIEDAGSLLARLQALAEGMGVAFTEDDTALKADFSHLMGPDAPIGLFIEAPKQGGALILYSHKNWTAESTGIRLTETETFKKLADRLPSEGIAFNYSVGSDLEPLLASMSKVPEAAPYKAVAESVIDLLLGDFLKPSMGVTYMEGQHMVSDQYAGYSTKQVAMVIPTVFAGGLGAAMAIPAFQKVRTSSQEKAVTNNLRQIAAAADQYFLENGVTEVSIDELIGEGGYIRELPPVAGESYEGMIIKQGEDISVVLENGSVISMPF